MDATTKKQVKILTACLADGLLYLNDEADAHDFQDNQGAQRVNLTMPANPEYETKSQYGFISIAFHPDGRVEIALEGLVRSGRRIRVEATAPSFTISETKVKPRDFPGY